MADSKIEWTGRVWNPVAGCSVHTPGCTNCYAMRMAARLEAMGQEAYAGLTTKTKAGPVWNGKVRPILSALTTPLTWRKPQTIFVNSMSDLFHEGVADWWVDQIFAVMALTPQHTYQVLTKRPDRMSAYLAAAAGRIADAVIRLRRERGDNDPVVPLPHVKPGAVWWPLPNVWLGASVEDQVRADDRRAPMAQIAAGGWTTFASYEPALGPVDWTGWEFLRWMICGGESGPRARHMHPDWARAARDFCAASLIAFFFKQWGTYAWAERVAGDPSTLTAYRAGKKAAGRLLDGRIHDELPRRAA